MFRITFQDNCSFRICLCRQDQFTVTFGNVIKIPDVDYYEGPYEVTPRAWQETVLETKDKAMADDVTVLEIPYYETGNVYNGLTVYIANEV